MCILFHNYTKWGVPTDSYRGTIKQARVCRHCGKVQVRNIGYKDGLYAKGVNNSLGEFIIYCEQAGDLHEDKERLLKEKQDD